MNSVLPLPSPRCLCTQVRSSGESLTNCVALLWIEVGQPCFHSLTRMHSCNRCLATAFIECNLLCCLWSLKCVLCVSVVLLTNVTFLLVVSCYLHGGHEAAVRVTSNTASTSSDHRYCHHSQICLQQRY